MKQFARKGGPNVFRKEREQYVEIQDLKAQMQDKNMAISELKKLVEKCKGKSVDTKFDKPSVVRQPNAQRIPKPSVLGKPAPFSDSLERKYFAKKKSVPKTNESEGLSKPVTLQNLPKTAMQAVRNTNVIKPGMYRIASRENSSQKLITSNANAVCATCGKCVFNSNHDACVSKFLNDVNARTKKLIIVQLIIFTVTLVAPAYDGQCITAFWIKGNIHVQRVYYVEVFIQSFLSWLQFCDADLEVAFQKSTCFVRDLQGNDLLSGNRGSDLYTISLQETTSSTPICLLAKASPRKHGYGIEDVLISTLDYINLLS
ncbi:hypothetical protein Tco_0804717 [Tanacetum coccineum]|uniref:Integrase, catalytic region, zinc finger, CCHC-type, peptidase aspartic, catalytic n=1 Tax=Tanacetum coccineum TaxID=301880 RepID=A0ABQ5A531_9ASTR